MSAYPARVEPENRVLSPSTCVASQTGFSAAGLFDLECSLNDEVDVRQVWQGEENNYAVSGDDDGISPDDAPEMVRDDLNEENNTTAPNVGTLGRPQTSAEAIKAMAAYLEDQMFAGFGALRVAHGKKEDGRQSPLPDTKSKKGKKGPKKSKRARVTTEESSRQMRTSGCAESSRTRLKEFVAEDLVVPSHLCNTLSTSLPQQGESQQPGECPLKVQDALQLEDNNRPAPAPSPPPPGQITPVVCVFPPGGSAAQTTTEGRGQDDTLSGVDGSHSVTSPRNSDKDASIAIRDTPYDAPRVAYKSEQVKLVNETRIAFGKTGRTESEQRVTGHDENPLPLMQNLPVACGGRTLHRAVHPVRLGTAGQVVADLRPSSSSAKPVKPLRNWRLRELNSLKVDSDDEVDMEAPDAFIPMDEDEFGFGPASNIAFDPCLAYQQLPYNHDTDLEQINALNNGLGSVEDSVMEDAGTELAVGTVIPTQAIQQPLVNTLSTSSGDYGLFSNDQFYTGVQTAALGNNPMHSIQSTMLSDLNALENRASAHASFPQFVLPQEIASLFVSDVVQSSALVLRVGPFREQRVAVANASPAPVLSPPAGYPTAQFSSRASPPSPPRATPASSPTRRTIEMRTNRLEDLGGVVDPQPPVVADIQREASPFSSQQRQVTVRDAGATQKILQHSCTETEDSFPAKSGLNTASSNHSISTSATPTKPKEDAGKQVNEGCINGDKRSRKEEQGTDDSILKVTRHFIQTSPPVVRRTATTRSPSPAVPTRVAGSKRKITDDQAARCDSTNHPELPRLKKRKFEHVAYSTHARLEKVKVMDRYGTEATSLTEAIKLAGRRRLAAWSSSTAPTGGLANPGAP